jgi:hypothetical protein
MPTPRTRAARHGSGRVRRAPDLRALGVATARCGAKSLVGIGLVAGVGTGVVAVAADVPADAFGGDGEPGTSDPVANGMSAELARSRTADGVSRSALRDEAPGADAVAAPTWQAGVARPDYGALDVSAVAKPEPKPEPEPELTETAPEPTPTSTTSTTTTAAPTTPDPLVTDAYLAEAQALGLGPNAQRVYSAVRTEFPSLTDIGGYRAGDPGDHGTGHAVDIMCSTAEGDAVAAFLQAHAGELNIKYIIWKQRIWYPGGTWEWMEDRGSVTQNHYDHVHVSVY